MARMDSPVEIIVKDLDGSRLDLSRRLLRYCDNDRWIRLSNHVARLALPLKVVPMEHDCIDIRPHSKPSNPLDTHSSHVKVHLNVL